MDNDLVKQSTPPSDDDIKDIVEEAVDDELPEFDMAKNFYEDYGMDSLGAIALVTLTQKAFGVRIPDERMPTVLTGNALRDVIVELQQQKAEGVEVPVAADA